MTLVQLKTDSSVSLSFDITQIRAILTLVQTTPIDAAKQPVKTKRGVEGLWSFS
ncbi:MAG: hypothetical protein ABJH45_10600 [Paracoccaceae bacterium]